MKTSASYYVALAILCIAACSDTLPNVDNDFDVEVTPDAGVDHDVGMTTDVSNTVVFENFDPEIGDPLWAVMDLAANEPVGSTSEKCHVSTTFAREQVPDVLPNVGFDLNREQTALLDQVFTPTTEYRYSMIKSADVNLDGIDDLVVYGHVGNEDWRTRVFLGDLDGGYSPGESPPWGYDGQVFLFADIDADRNLDVVCGSDNPGEIAIYYGTEDGFQSTAPHYLPLAEGGEYVHSVTVLPRDGQAQLDLFVARFGINTLLLSSGSNIWDTIPVPSRLDGEDTFYGTPLECPDGTCIVVDNDGRSSQEAYVRGEGNVLELIEDDEIILDPSCNILSGVAFLKSYSIDAETATTIDWETMLASFISSTGQAPHLLLGLLSGSGNANPMAMAYKFGCYFPSLEGTGDVPVCLDQETQRWYVQSGLTIPNGLGIRGGNPITLQSWGRRFFPTPTPVVLTAWGNNSSEGGEGEMTDIVFETFGVETGDVNVEEKSLGLHGLIPSGWQPIETDQNDRIDMLTVDLGWTGTSEQREAHRAFASSFNGTARVYDTPVGNQVLSLRLHGNSDRGVPTEGYGARVDISCQEVAHDEDQRMGFAYTSATSGNGTLGRMDFGVPEGCDSIDVTVIWSDSSEPEAFTEITLGPAQSVQSIYQP